MAASAGVEPMGVSAGIEPMGASAGIEHGTASAGFSCIQPVIASAGFKPEAREPSQEWHVALALPCTAGAPYLTCHVRQVTLDDQTPEHITPTFQTDGVYLVRVILKQTGVARAK